MAEIDTAARPYARAIFELAQEEGKLQDWEDILQVAAEIADHDDMQALFSEPRLLPKDLAELFLSVVEGAGVKPDAHLKNLVLLLADNDRLAALPSITQVFGDLKQEAEGKIEVRVRSAQELSDAQQKNIAESMAKRLGKEVTLTTEIDESLIAGAVITAGDLVIDGSASGRMHELAVALTK